MVVGSSSTHNYANPSPGMRHRTTKQTMAPELEVWVPVSERHVGQCAYTAPRGPPARRGPGQGLRWRGEEEGAPREVYSGEEMWLGLVTDGDAMSRNIDTQCCFNQITNSLIM